MANKFDYSGVRPYIEQPLITSEEATTLNLSSDLKEYIYIQSSEANLQKEFILMKLHQKTERETLQLNL